MANLFTSPKRTMMGEGAFNASKELICKQGKKAFIVSGKHVTKAGIVKQLTDILDEASIEYYVYNEILGEPTDTMINEGVRFYKENNCDFCIGIGGGSPLDSAKAIQAMAALNGNIVEYAGREIAGNFPPLVLIPTTAGTGSEATKFLCVTDSSTDTKYLLKGDDLLPDVAIVDPAFSKTAPPSVTAATGMDALTHAVEAFTSRKANTLTDTYALSAIKRIFKYLPIAYNDGNNMKAREEMSIAAYEAGVCINNSSVTLVHGMSRPIGAMFHVPHGISNAMLIKECLSYALDGCYDRFAAIARAIDSATNETTDNQAAQSFIYALEEICRKCQIPTLAEYGIDKQKFFDAMNKMAEDALASGSPANTIKEVDKKAILDIYAKLW